MKKKFALGLIASLLTVSLTGCSLGRINPADAPSGEIDPFGNVAGGMVDAGDPEQVNPDTNPAESGVDYEMLYSGIMNTIYNALVTSPDTLDEFEGSTGILEAAMYAENPLDSIGYTFMDLDGDGMDELVVATQYDYENATSILAVYSVVKGNVINVVEGWGRNRYYLCDDGYFCHQGSSGAAWTEFGKSRIDETGRAVEFVDFYFTEPDEEDFTIMYYCHNTTGVWDHNEAESLSEEEFWEFYDAIYDEAVSIELTPFAQYEPSGEASTPGNALGAEPAKVQVGSGEVLGTYTDCTEFVADESEYQTRVVIYTDKNITDFRFLSLEYLDMQDENTVIYNVDVLYYKDVVSPDCPMVVDMTFWGDMPSYGYSYTDDAGEHFFSLSQSGFDGSIVTESFVAGNW